MECFCVDLKCLRKSLNSKAFLKESDGIEIACREGTFTLSNKKIVLDVLDGMLSCIRFRLLS